MNLEDLESPEVLNIKEAAEADLEVITKVAIIEVVEAVTTEETEVTMAIETLMKEELNLRPM